ncbi:hypothetical protein ACFLXQ_00370 [Chloroflexota bacterium]
MSPWERLAKKNYLTYVPGDFFQKEIIKGPYRGYYLTMTHWNFGVEIILSIDGTYPAQDNDKFTNKTPTPKPINHLITTSYLLNIAQGYLRVENDGRKILYHHLETLKIPRNNIKHFQKMIDLLCELGDNYRLLLAVGGTTVLMLEQEMANYLELSPFAHQLLQDIGKQTKNQLRHRTSLVLCPHCLYRFQMHQVNISSLLEKLDSTYIGCRICHQSQTYIECKTVIALLNNRESAEEQHFQDQTLRVNWLMRRKLFDFDWVEIIQATDEDVERFAVQVGNDTDPMQARRYKGMHCFVSPTCNLSENTMRILRRMFGEVRIEESPLST